MEEKQEGSVPPKTAGAPRLDASGMPLGPNGGRNRMANKFPATCYRCGARIPRGQGRVVAWHSKKDEGKPLRVQCYSHVQEAKAIAAMEAQQAAEADADAWHSQFD